MNRGCTIVLDKGYVDEEFTNEMESHGIRYIAIKRRNMIKDKRERKYYKNLAKARKIIETRFSQLEEYGLRFIRTVSRRGLAIKIILSILAFNICQMMKFDGNYVFYKFSLVEMHGNKIRWINRYENKG